MRLVDYPGHIWAIAMIVIAAILLLLAYRSKITKTINIWRWLLGLLQLAVIIILLIIIWNPSRPEYDNKTAKNTVLVFFDTSQSMSVPVDQMQDRLEQAISVFEHNFAPGDLESPKYHYYGFGRQCYRCDSLDSLERWGAMSNIMPVNRTINRMFAYSENCNDQAKVVGSVIFTDGQVTDKGLSKHVNFVNNPMDVVVIGVGEQQPRQCDLAITSIKAPDNVQVDTNYKVTVQVQCDNISLQTIRLELRKDDMLIAFKDITADQLDENNDITFTIGADILGGHILEVSAGAIGNEINLANNINRTVVNVIEDSKLKVLLYSEVASIDFGKVRSSLVRDKKIQLDVGLNAVKNVSINYQTKDTDGHFGLPDDLNGFCRYDIIILGPCDYRKLSSAQIKGLYHFVTERGGGLIFLGDRNGYTHSNCPYKDIQALLPIEFDSFANNYSAQLSKATLTLEGIKSNILPKMQRKPIYSAEQIYIDNHPLMITPLVSDIIKKPAATTMVTAGDCPIVCLQRIGRGRTCFINTYGLYRLYREDLDGGLLRELFSGLTSYIGQISKSQAGIELFAKRKEGEPKCIVFDAMVYDESFESVSGATVLLTVGDNVLTMQQTSPGHYSCSIDSIKDQALVVKAEAQKNGVFLGEKVITKTLPILKSEMDNVNPDRQYLLTMANKLDYKYIDIEDVDEKVVQQYEAVTEIETISLMSSIWPQWPLFIILCSILTLYWFIRRAKGLI